MWNKITEFLNHERYQVISIGLACVLLLWLFSCESKVRSIANPLEMVGRDQLQAEVAYFLAKVEIRVKDLDRQDELKRLIIEKAVLFAQGGTINPVGLFVALAGILGTGAAVDNVRKRKEIKTIVNNVMVDAKNKTEKC